MKVLRILIIVLVPALGFVGCRKSNCGPANENHTLPATAEPTDKTSTSGSNERRLDFLMLDGESDVKNDDGVMGSDVVVSGDDDRDGGDKKQKKVGR